MQQNHHTNMLAHTHTHTDKHTKRHIWIHKHRQIHALTQTHRQIHTYTDIYTDTHTHTHNYTQVHTRTHKYTHTSTHTQTNTCTHLENHARLVAYFLILVFRRVAHHTLHVLLLIHISQTLGQQHIMQCVLSVILSSSKWLVVALHVVALHCPSFLKWSLFMQQKRIHSWCVRNGRTHGVCETDTLMVCERRTDSWCV